MLWLRKQASELALDIVLFVIIPALVYWHPFDKDYNQWLILLKIWIWFQLITTPLLVIAVIHSAREENKDPDLLKRLVKKRHMEPGGSRPTWFMIPFETLCFVGIWLGGLGTFYIGAYAISWILAIKVHSTAKEKFNDPNWMAQHFPDYQKPEPPASIDSDLRL